MRYRGHMQVLILVILVTEYRTAYERNFHELIDHFLEKQYWYGLIPVLFCKFVIFNGSMISIFYFVTQVTLLSNS